MGILISINHSNLNMILSGEKWLDFRDDILDELKPCEACETIYICETKNNKGGGKVIAEANPAWVYSLHYDDEIQTDSILEHKRFSAIKQLYYEWCRKKGVKPDPNEGWSRSMQFQDYLERIGFGGNYAIYLTDITKYDSPSPLTTFTDKYGDAITTPPLNMVYCNKSCTESFAF